LEEFGGAVVEADRAQVGRDDAPDLPDRETDMLGEDRPDEIAAGDRR
jgi:hypothetical protein